MLKIYKGFSFDTILIQGIDVHLNSILTKSPFKITMTQIKTIQHSTNKLHLNVHSTRAQQLPLQKNSKTWLTQKFSSLHQHNDYFMLLAQIMKKQSQTLVSDESMACSTMLNG